MTRIKCLCTALAAALLAPVFAGVPIKWTVESSMVEPQAITAYHGEALELTATLKSYGSDLDLSGKTANLYYRSLSMPDNLYWIAPASANGNVLSATFDGTMDPGEPRLVGFIGVQGEIYRAAFTIRLLAAPGFTPGTQNLPTKTLDFSYLDVENSPYPTFSEAAGIATNATIATVTRAFIEALGISGGDHAGSVVDTNTVKDIVKDVMLVHDEDDGKRYVECPDYFLGDVNFQDSVIIEGHLGANSDHSYFLPEDGTPEGYIALREDIVAATNAVKDIVMDSDDIWSDQNQKLQNYIKGRQLYDSTLGVTWNMVMENGNLYTIAVTNINITSEN